MANWDKIETQRPWVPFEFRIKEQCFPAKCRGVRLVLSRPFPVGHARRGGRDAILVVLSGSSDRTFVLVFHTVSYGSDGDR